MAENNATCSIFGKGYYACLSCRDSIKANPWKMHTDTAEHYKVYQIIHGFSTGVYTKNEVKAKLKNVYLDDLDTFRPHIKQIIKDILKEEKNAAKPVKKVVEPIKTEIAETKEETVVEDVENIIKPIVSRKRNFKVETE